MLGNKGSPRQTTASSFKTLAALVVSSIPLGSTPPLFQTWVLMVHVDVVVRGQLALHRNVHFAQPLQSTRSANNTDEGRHVFSRPHPRMDSFENPVLSQSKRHWHEGSPCSPPSPCGCTGLCPQICGWAPAETSLEGEDVISPLQKRFQNSESRVLGELGRRTPESAILRWLMRSLSL